MVPINRLTFWEKVAVTVKFPVTRAVVGFVDPERDPLQPVNTQPALGEAENVTFVPYE
jgi:hypothetical protein